MMGDQKASYIFKILTVGVFLAASPGLMAQQQPVNTLDLLELGDGVEPLFPGLGDILGSVPKAGPDWDDLFAADGSAKDEIDELGEWFQWGPCGMGGEETIR